MITSLSTVAFSTALVNALLILPGVLVGLALLLIVAERLLVNYGVCKVEINSGESILEVDGGQTLLSSLIGGQVFIPSACGGRGSCGYCKITVPHGGGPVLPTETPYLSRREVRSGLRLACQVKVRDDIQVRIPEDLLNVKLYCAAVTSVIDLTYDIKQIRLELNDPPEIAHRPGQYVQVRIPSGDGPVFRAYSISSPVYEPNEVELIVRLVPGGLGSTHLHGVRVGDPIAFTGPYGEFRLNENPEVEIICVGGGCGMAPIKNIIYTLYDRWPGRVCRLFFGARIKADVFLLEELTELSHRHPNFHVVYALSDRLRPNEPWDGETGFIHLSVDRFLDPGARRQAFLCGPGPMIQAVTGVLKEKGLRKEDIFYDEF